MDQVRRSALAILICGILSTTGAHAAPALVLTSPAGAGSLRVVNAGPRAVAIQNTIDVEERTGAVWTKLSTEFNAIAACAQHMTATPVQIAAGATLDVVQWRGYSCAGQCETICRANIYFGPNVFRFVVTILPAGLRVAGPTFALPSEAMPQ